MTFESVCPDASGRRGNGGAVIYDEDIEIRTDFPRLTAINSIDDCFCAAILRDALAARGLLRMRAAVGCGASTISALILVWGVVSRGLGLCVHGGLCCLKFSFFVRARQFLRPEHRSWTRRVAVAVKADRRSPPEAARSGLDGGEHGARLVRLGRGERAMLSDVNLDWAVNGACGTNTASPCIRSGARARYPNSSCTGEGMAQKRRDPSERAGV